MSDENEISPQIQEELDFRAALADNRRDEITRLKTELAAASDLIREILYRCCEVQGLSLESSIVPGVPARNYELAMRLGIGDVFEVNHKLVDDKRE